MGHYFSEKYGVELSNGGCLNLTDTGATDDELVHVAEIPNVRSLYVSRVTTDRGLENLRTAVQLRSIYLGDRGLRKERAREILGNAIPELVYYY